MLVLNNNCGTRLNLSLLSTKRLEFILSSSFALVIQVHNKMSAPNLLVWDPFPPPDVKYMYVDMKRSKFSASSPFLSSLCFDVKMSFCAKPFI